MRVAPGESYADIHDWDYERACLRDRAIANLEEVARERCDEFFIDNLKTSMRAWELTVEHDAIADALVYAAIGYDTCEMGLKLQRAVSAARMKFTNENWKAFATFAVDHRGDGQTWPQNDKDIAEGLK